METTIVYNRIHDEYKYIMPFTLILRLLYIREVILAIIINKVVFKFQHEILYII